MTAAPVKLAAITVQITPPGGPAQTLNVTDKDARRAGTPSPIDSIQTSWGLAGPVGQPQPAESRLSIISADPTPYPLNSGVQVTLTPDGSPDDPFEIVYGWTDEDKITPTRMDGAMRFRHDLNVLDPLQIAADRPVGITRPAEGVVTRFQAIQAAHPDLLDVGLPAATLLGSLVVAALDPTTSLLDALRQIAVSAGLMVQNWGSTFAPIVLMMTYPQTAEGVPWFMNANAAMNGGNLVDLPPDRVEEVPSSLSRTARITAVNITYVTTAGAAVTYTVGSITAAFPTVLEWKTGIVTDNLNTNAAGAWLLKLATEIVTRGYTPLPALASGLSLSPELASDLATLTNVTFRQRGAILELSPTPAGVARFHVCASGTLTVNPDLTYNLNINPIPAGLYGLMSPPFNQLRAADTFRTANSPFGTPNTFRDLRATYSRNVA